MFKTLDQTAGGRNRRGAAFVGGLFIEIGLIAGAAYLAVLFPEHIAQNPPKYVATFLAEFRPPEPPKLEEPPKPRIVTPRVRIAAVKPEEVPPPRPEPPKIEPLKIEPPKVEPKPAPVPDPVRQAFNPPPPVPQPTPAPKPRVEVKTGLFGGATPEPVTVHKPVEQVQTGGFGSPEGLPGRALGGNPGNVAKLGSFGLPDGPGNGNGRAGSKGTPGVVASAGFGSGVAGPGTGNGNAKPVQVALGGFNQPAAAAPSPSSSLPAPHPANFQPVEILSKPSPVYTEEARRSGVQGEVALSVVFQASGTIKVVGIVKSLGHGLDEAAQHAALQIRFKPAQRDGKPADFPATLRIEFRLADQS